MLAELAAANAAYKIIRTAISNGSDLMKVGSSIGAWVNAKEDLTKKATVEKNSIWHRGKDPEMLESFMALEQVKQQQKEIEQAMIYYGRPGLYGDWVKYQAEARKQRIADAALRAKKRQELIEILGYTLAFLLFGIGVTALIWFVVFLKNNGG